MIEENNDVTDPTDAEIEAEIAKGQVEDIEIVDAPRYIIWQDGDGVAVWDMQKEAKVKTFKSESEAEKYIETMEDR